MEKINTNEEEIAIEIVKQHLKNLTDQRKIEEIRKEYFELSIKHALTTISFIPKHWSNEDSWNRVSEHVLKITPSKLFEIICD